MRFVLLILLLSLQAAAVDLSYSTRLSPSDYLLQSRDSYHDPVFDDFKTIDLGATVGVGSDCGRIDFGSTLRSSLKNILDAKYFLDIGKDIIGSSPMLLACYFSPTWCAILKHSQISAHYLAQMRLNQCSLVDKYTDSRVEDFYEARQSCVRRSIEENGGDLEHAMETCRGKGIWDADLPNWAGAKYGETASDNHLLESSAKWAGFQGRDAQSSMGLLKSLVGDTIVARGKVSVEYGPAAHALTPRTYLQSIEKSSYDTLCRKLMKRVNDGQGNGEEVWVTDDELKSLAPELNRPLIDRATIRSLAALPRRQQLEACKTLSDAISLTVFSQSVNRSLDMLTTMAQNPNLPPHRKAEIEEKRKALKDSVDLTIALQKERNVPLNTALYKINEQGARAEGERVSRSLSDDAEATDRETTRARLLDCSDGLMCDGR